MPDSSAASAAGRDLVNLRWTPARTAVLATRLDYVIKRVGVLTAEERARLLAALDATAEAAS